MSKRKTGKLTKVEKFYIDNNTDKTVEEIAKEKPESIIRSKINKSDIDEVIFGQVLTGGREGVVGINYDLKGPLSNLKVEVNPLSILVPEVLKEIVSVRSTR